jgi:hypothetical protein
MPKKYLGEEVLESLKGTPFEKFGPTDWAMYFIESYGQIDGAHHKLWVLDQAARILKGTPIEVKIARWDNGLEEHRVSTLAPSKEYLDWAVEMLGNYDDEEECHDYSYDEGIAP